MRLGEIWMGEPCGRMEQIGVVLANHGSEDGLGMAGWRRRVLGTE